MRSCIFFRESLLLRLRFSHLRQGQIQGTLRLLVNADHLVDEGRIIQSVQHVLLIQQTDLQLTVVDKGNAVVLQLLSVSFDVREQLIDSYPSQTEVSTTGILRIVLSRVLQSVFLPGHSRFLCLRRRRFLLFAKQSCEHSLSCPFRLTDCRKKSGRFWCSSYTRLSHCVNVILTLTELRVSSSFSIRRCLCNPCNYSTSPCCGRE